MFQSQEARLIASRALARLAAAAGLSELVDGNRPLPLPSDGEVPLAPIDWLMLTAGSTELPLSLIEATPAEALQWIERGDPLLTEVSAEGDERPFWAVLHWDGPSIAVTLFGPGGERSTEVDAATLPEQLGVEPERRLRWILAQRAVAAPASSVASSNGTPLHPLKRLIRLLSPDRADLFAVTMFAVLVGVLMLATPVAVQAVVNFVALGGAIPPLFVVVGLLFLGLLFANVLTAMQTYTVEIVQRRLFVRTVADLATRLPRVALGPGRTGYGPELVNRYFDLQTIQKQGAFLILDGLSLLLSVLIGLILLAFYHPLLLAFDIIIVAAIALIVLGPIRRGIASAKKESTVKYEMAAWLEELARNPLMFKSSGIMKSVYERSDRLANDYVEARRRHFRIAFGQGVSALMLQVLASTALLGIGGLLVINGSLTLGQLVAAELILTVVLSSVAKLGKQVEAFYDLMAATDKLGKLLDLPMERSGGEQYFPATDCGGARLELDGVAWTPKGGKPLLNDISVDIQPGERIGIHGGSGSGKTLLLKLIWDVLAPTRGSIQLDGRDVRELSLESLRRSVGLADQVEALDVSVRENVRLGRSFVTDDAVRDALRRVGLLDELTQLPDGVDTHLGFDGAPLSNGQLSRLQLARAIACAPRLLLVSDRFDALDRAERGVVHDVLLDEDASWTLVLVTNSREALARCDRTFQLVNGKLVPDEAVSTPPAADTHS